MEINANFEERVIVHGSRLEWTPSPMQGVDRRMLDRIGDEVARATSIVRYAKGSSFPEHTHGGGEEFIVLEGVFQDEHGDYPAGTYVRNPPTTHHIPRSDDGCTIFVKLWQFQADDRNQLTVDMNALDFDVSGETSGIASHILHQDMRETVSVEQWQSGARAELVSNGGIEILVLEGSIDAVGETLGTQGWLRMPDGDSLVIRAGAYGAKIWRKSRHLRHVSAPNTE